MTAKDKWIAEKCLRLIESAKKAYSKSRCMPDQHESIRVSCEADADLDSAREGLRTLLGWD